MTPLWGRIAAGIAIVVMSVPAMMPLLTTDYLETNDGTLHFFRLVGLADAFRQGVLFPRIFPSFSYEYGTAVLNHYGPFSYYLAILPHLFGATIAACLKWAFALGFIGSGASIYVLARRFASYLPALAAAAAYIYFPYHISDVYERGALAEHIAWIFPPLILFALTPAATSGEKPAVSRWLPLPAADVARIASAAVMTAALIITHPPIALMFLPFVVLYGWAMARESAALRRRIADPLLTVGGGAALSAFYWLPALAEGGWILLSTMAEGNWAAMRYEYHIAPLLGLIQPSLRFDYSHPSAKPTFALGLLSALALTGGIIAAVIAWRRRYDNARALALFAALALAALFMVTDASLPLWHTLNRLLAFVQFPWRFMVPAALGIAMVTAIGLRSRLAAAIALPVFVLAAGFDLPVLPAAVPVATFNAMWRNEFTGIALGTAWDREYLPRWVGTDVWQIPRPSQRPASDVVALPPTVRVASMGYTRRQYQVDSAIPSALVFHRFYLPSWRATLDGKPLPTYPSGELGLLAVTVPATNAGLLEVDFGPSNATVWGLAISVAALLGLVIATGSRKLAAIVAVGLALVAMASVAAGGTQPAVQPVHAQFEDGAELLAMVPDRETVKPGETLQVTLFWLARRRFSEDVRVFLHAEQDGRRLAQSDGDPVHLYTPTTRWEPGEVVEDVRSLRIPVDAAPGPVRLLAGMYRVNPLRNLPATQGGRTIPDGRAMAGEVAVIAR